MKKFVLMTIGFSEPTPDIMNAWMKWFKSIESNIVEQVGLSNGKEITKTGVTGLPMDQNAITGYLVVNAKNMDEALKMAESCPMVTGTKVYEIRSH